MSAIERIKALQEKHRQLEEKILQESNKPGISDAMLHDLKKQRLKLKEEIEKLTGKKG